MISADVRARLTHALRLDLIGPEPDEPQAGEVLAIPPSRCYLTGFLAPLNAPASQEADEDEQGELEQAAAGGGAGDDDSTPIETCPWCGTKFKPTSFNLSPNADEPHSSRTFECRWGGPERCASSGECGISCRATKWRCDRQRARALSKNGPPRLRLVGEVMSAD